MPTTRRALISGALATALPVRRLLATVRADDVAVLRQAYTAMHPGLYRYASPRQVDARLTALERAWHGNDDLAARYLALSRFCATVRCGHSYANFYNQKPAVATALFAGRNRLPFTFRWLGARMIVTAAGALPRGTEVLRIDGRAVAEILAALMPLARADGSNDGKRRALLGVAGIDDYESFDIYYPLLFPAGESFRLDLRLPNGVRRTLRLPAIDLAQRRAARSADLDDAGWTLEHRGRSAILTMPDWALYDSKWDWKGWIDARMEELAQRGTTGLVVDVRANEGGLDCGDEIVARLIDATLRPEMAVPRVRYRRAPEALLPHLETWDSSFRDWGADAIDRGDGWYDLKRPSEQSVIQPKGPRYRGALILLVGPQNSSATFQFARLIRDHRLGTLVGATTGGNRRGINGGAFFFVRLPGGLEVDLPLIGYFPTCPQPDAGLVPDIAVADTVADIAAGHDAVLARALAMLA